MHRTTVIAPALLLLLVMVPCAPGVATAATIQSFQMTGHLGVQVLGDGLNAVVGAASSISGSFSVAPFVPGGFVLAAFYANDWGNAGGPIDLLFNGAVVPPGPILPSQSDTAGFLTLSTYRWNVGALIPVPGTYTYTIGLGAPGQQLYGAALVLVYADPLAPLTTVTVIEGARQVGDAGPETESFVFTGLPAGPTSLWVFTGSDDSASTGEVVSYGGVTAGPLDANLGIGASLTSLSATSTAGTNTLSITTGSDLFGLIVAVTAVTPAATPIPQPSVLWLLAAALPVLPGLRRRSPRRSRGDGSS